MALHSFRCSITTKVKDFRLSSDHVRTLYVYSIKISQIPYKDVTVNKTVTENEITIHPNSNMREGEAQQ